jgi:hypothetical protein
VADIVRDFKQAWEAKDNRIKHIWVVLNPEKLRPWTTG